MYYYNKMIVPKVTFLVLIVVITISVSLLEAETNDDFAKELDKNVVYNFMFRTRNGIERHEEGTLKQGPVSKFVSVAGSYEYEANGIVTLVTFIADENGFKPITQIRRRINNDLPVNFTLDNRIDPKLLGTLAGGGLG